MTRLALLLWLSGCDLVFGLEDASSACPSTFDEAGHAIVFADVDWPSAEASCRSFQLPDSSRQPHLVVLSSAAETAAVIALAGDTPVWVGLTDRRFEGGFTWITRERAPVPWAPGQPNETSDYAQDCALLTPQGIEDKPCEAGVDAFIPSAYACECDANVVDPETF